MSQKVKKLPIYSVLWALLWEMAAGAVGWESVQRNKTKPEEKEKGVISHFLTSDSEPGPVKHPHLLCLETCSLPL